MMQNRSPGRVRILPAFIAILGLFACGGGESPASTSTAATSGTSSSASGAGGSGGTNGTSTSSGTSGTGGAPSKAAGCAATFGTELTSAFGRLDGVVTAVVKPVDVQCPMPNSDHLVIQARMNGAVYRLVVNIQSTIGDPNVAYLAIDHALPPPAWSEGWHTNIMVDYVATFGVHSPDFTPLPLTQLADTVTDAITIGQKISVYALTTGGSSAHNIHRNSGTTDGAVVLDPEGALPRVLLFHFSDQTF
jgi:hypothetical protein